MLKESNENSKSVNVFSNMFSILNPSTTVSATNLLLPNPFTSQSTHFQKLPSIFLEEPKKKCKKVTACPHSARKHYAKNMCNNCYHRLGRDKTAWDCEHSDRKHYAKGKCQFCYLKSYNRSRQDAD